jgi:predicted aldo/keto reductase-like oxidoreductase
MDRREFLKTAAVTGLTAALADQTADAAQKPLPRRKLGRTGEQLSIIGLGGIVVIGNEQEQANRIVRGAVDRGVNYFDVAPSYGNGEAEEKLGPALQGYRNRVFLTCKTGRRDKAGAEEELQRSLKRLRTDHFDLYQLHALTSREDVEQALGPGGAIEAFAQARQKGLVRFLGFSAHSVEAALTAMDRFSFDTILFPFNWVCWSQGDFGPQVLKAARAKDMGCLALKAMAHHPWPRGAKRDYPKCWYQPITDPELAALALRFTLSEPVTAAIPPGDERLFNLALSVAGQFKPLSGEERRQLLARAAGEQPIFRHTQA